MSATLNDVAARCRRRSAVRRHPGLQYVVVDRSSTVFEAHEGLADIAASRPMLARTTMMAYSMSKTITAAAVLQLVEAGRLRLDDPVAQYLDWQPYGRRHHDPSAPVAHVGDRESDSAAMGAPGAGTRRLRRARHAEGGHDKHTPAGVQAGREVRLLEHRLLAVRRHRRAGNRTALHVVRHATRARTARDRTRRDGVHDRGSVRCTRRGISRSTRGSICSSAC